jgi:hypothetical protein
VCIGYQAGYYETGTNKLFIDNQSRASEADGRVKALVYGVFDATVANQSITFNVGAASFGAGNVVTTGDMKAATYHVGTDAGIDATVPVAPVLPATVAGSMTFKKGILTAYTAPS